MLYLSTQDVYESIVICFLVALCFQKRAKKT